MENEKITLRYSIETEDNTTGDPGFVTIECEGTERAVKSIAEAMRRMGMTPIPLGSIIMPEEPSVSMNNAGGRALSMINFNSITVDEAASRVYRAVVARHKFDMEKSDEN